jgi:hypothetical protein
MQEQEGLGPLEPQERAEPAADEEPEPGGWFDCTVTAAGAAENGNVYIGLREINNRWVPLERWYAAEPTMSKEMLATALTAITTQLPVRVNLSPWTTTAYGTINRLYVFMVP